MLKSLVTLMQAFRDAMFLSFRAISLEKVLVRIAQLVSPAGHELVEEVEGDLLTLRGGLHGNLEHGGRSLCGKTR